MINKSPIKKQLPLLIFMLLVFASISYAQPAMSLGLYGASPASGTQVAPANTTLTYYINVPATVKFYLNGSLVSTVVQGSSGYYTYSYSDLPSGTNTFSVTATAPWGSSDTKTMSYVVNVAPPSISINSVSPASGSQTAPASVTMSFTFTQGGSISFYLDGSVVSGTGSGPGTYSYTYSNLSAGTHTLQVTVSNANGSNSASMSYVVNAAPPSITINSVSPEPGSQSEPANATISFSFNQTCGVNIYLDGTSVGGGSAGAGTYTHMFTNLTAGTHTFQVTVSNSNGSNSASMSYVVNAAPPSISINSVSPASASQTAPANATVSYTINQGGTISYYLDGSYVGGTGNGPGTYSYTYSNLSAGTHTLQITVSNSNGSNSASTSYIVNPPLQYTISLSSSPSNGGSTDGGGTYTYGSQATVTVSPAAGYTFSNWTENGSVVSWSASYSFTVTGNRNLVANFTAIQYGISTSSNPSNGGTTSGGDAYTYGSQATVTASPAAGYTFSNWTENGSVVSWSSSYTFTVTGNRNLVANFTEIPYTISLSSSPSSGGSTSGGGTYTYGSQATVTATLAAGYTFSNWTENGSAVSWSSSYSFTVTGNRNLVANFTATQYGISTSSNPSNGGTTSGGDAYTYGSQATVTAAPAAGYTFSNWTENGSVVSWSSSYSFTVSGSRNLVANFTVLEYTISTSSNPSNGGSTSGGTYTYGNQAMVTASPVAGYTFSNWTENGSVVSWSSSYSFTVTGGRNLVANFTAIPPTISIGGVSPTAGSQREPANVTLSYFIDQGGAVSFYLDGVPVGSTGNNAGFNNYSYPVALMEGAHTLLVIISNANGSSSAYISYPVGPPLYAISLSSSPTYGGTTTGSGNYDRGSQATVTATPAACYTFLNWTENGSAVSTSQSYPFTVNGNRNLVANFSLKQYTVVTSSNPPEGGTTTGSGTYNCESQVNISATANTGYAFANWTENGSIVSYSQSGTFTITNDRNLVANYALLAPPQTTISTAILSPCTVKINWDNVEREEGYRIYRSKNYANEFILIATVGSNAVEFTDSFILTEAATFYYKVCAYNSGGETSSNITSVVVNLPSPSGFEFTGTITSEITYPASLSTLDHSNDVLGVFVGDEFRGSAKGLNSVQKLLYFLTAYSNTSNVSNPEIMNFKVYIPSLNQVLPINNNKNIGFYEDLVLGKPSTPFALDIQSASGNIVSTQSNISTGIQIENLEYAKLNNALKIKWIINGTNSVEKIFIEHQDQNFSSNWNLVGSINVTKYSNYFYIAEKSKSQNSVFRVRVVDKDGNNWLSDNLEIHDEEMPVGFSLDQNYPNPFNPTTTIKFAIPSEGNVSLKVFNVLGQEVATLVNQQMKAGSYSFDWNASNLSSGVYFYRMETGSFNLTKKMHLLK